MTKKVAYINAFSKGKDGGGKKPIVVGYVNVKETMEPGDYEFALWEADGGKKVDFTGSITPKAVDEKVSDEFDDEIPF